ncbi:ABC-type branched-chain amino acid transport system, periplasmic component [Halovivax ruber XH-70]|uniref:ABC-type branched-chain amino acid transport system, periplasmic component n=1 Tax=Halovivax ruber (strain DSM 18193 / JCM 13892 / XH-70) TaxID=797302 RepID=L0IC72_HALRX|nr:ABC transporter substrate-binding protein [Halovivax ruber]AGB17175.1 ABC-type branched-chain amino acid transport system, periplasmic component [Halovivax ruber XH-70]
MVDRHKRRTVLSGVAVGALGSLSGCLDRLPGVGSGEADDGPGGLGRTIKIGMLHSLTGDLSHVGEPIRNAGELPITQLEAADVDLAFDVGRADAETDSAVGVREALRLAQAKYPAINGALSSDVTLQATQQVLIPYRTVSCSPASTSPTITTLNDRGLVFRTAVSDTLQGAVLARQAADEGYSSAATCYVNNDYGYQLSRAFERAFVREAGGTVAAQVPFEQAPEDGSISYADELETALADDPDVLVLIGYANSGAQLLRDLHDNGADPAVLVTDGMRDESLPGRVGEPIDHVRGTAPLSAGPGKDFFDRTYESTYDAPPDSTPFNAHSYDATAVLLLANAYAGANDGELIRASIPAVTDATGERIGPSDLARGIELAAQGDPVEYVGASSGVRFDENGDVVAANFSYWTYEGDSITQLDTVEY